MSLMHPTLQYFYNQSMEFPSRIGTHYLRYNSPSKFSGGPIVLLFIRLTSEYKMQVRSVVMLLENPIQLG